MDVLERINTVGMAVQILDAIPEGETKLKKLHASGNRLIASFSQRSVKGCGEETGRQRSATK
jgi:hypothetical protein